MSASPSDYVRQLLERLRPDRRTSLAIGLAAAACFGLAYRDALAFGPSDPSALQSNLSLALLKKPQQQEEAAAAAPEGQR